MRLRRKAFFGGFAGFVFERTLTSTSDYNARALAVAAGWDQVKPIIIQLTVPSGVTISGTTALLFTGSWPTGSALFLTVDAGGSIVGSGGYGGGGGSGASGGDAGDVGGTGGTAVLTDHPLTINNLGRIAGGGGGGGGGAGAFTYGTGGNPDAFANGGSGGGGAGSPPGVGASELYGAAGGSGYTSNPVGGAVATSGAGGNGGNLGAAGLPGGNTSNANGGPGGLAGAYISGAALVTWINTGTRLGRAI